MKRTALVLLCCAAGGLGVDTQGGAAIFGPEDFVRSSPGRIRPVTRSFGAPPGPGSFCLVNGGALGQFARVSSAVVTLNGQTIAGPSAFNQQVAGLTRAVTLAASNTLVVEVRSAPGSGLTLSIVRGSSCTASPANTPPIADAGPDQQVLAGQLVTLDGRASSDPDQDPLTFAWSFISRPSTSQSTLLNPTSRTPTFTPDVPGDYTISLRVEDGRGGAAADSLIVSTNPVNRAPAITSQPLTTARAGQPYTYDVEANDPDNDSLIYELVFAPTGMTIDAQSGVVSWVPTPQQAGVRSAHVRVSDGQGGTANQGLAISVAAPLNRAPASQDDAYEVRLGDTLAVGPPGVLANDADPDATPLSAEVVTPPGEGALTLNANGGFTYASRPLAAPGALNPVVEWTKRTFRVAPASRQIMMTPVVADVTMDGVPDVAVVTHAGSSWTGRGYLRLLAGGPAALTNFNLVRLPSAAVQVSSSFSASFAADRAIDGDLQTSWFTARPDTSAFYQVTFASNVTVRTIRMFGNRQFASGHDFLSGVFQLFGASEALLFDSGPVVLPAPDRDVTLALPTAVVGVRRVRFVATGYEAPTTDHGFAELEIIGDAIADPGTELWTATDPSLEVHGSSGLAAGDIDGDGRFEIVAQDEFGGLIAVEHDGALKWRSVPLGLGGNTVGSPLIADLDADGSPEIVVGAAVLDSSGAVRWQGPSTSDTGDNGFGPISVAADLDLDGRLEVLTGKTAFRADGSVLWTTTLPDAFVAVGNFDADPFPEIVHVAGGNLRLLEHTGQVKWGPMAIPGGGRGGPPTVADMDRDGEPEIGVAGSTRYVVFETTGAVKWQAVTQDGSSNVTGSSVFDFEGDGSAEVVYGDELFLRIYRGTDGAVLYELAKGSATLHEIPIVVDVDGDGRAEIVAAANDWLHGAESGLFVIGGASGDWIPTRAIWNQHSYHVTNVGIDGAIPAGEPHHWLIPGLNTFRQNAFAPGDRPHVTTFTYRASDGALSSGVATVRITVRPPNTAPRIVTVPPLTAASGLEYLYGVAIDDSDVGDLHTFTLLGAPGGMTIDAATGLVRWTPSAAQIGQHPVVLRVVDRGGLVDVQSYTVNVSAPQTVPDVIGQDQAQAMSTLAAAGLGAGPLTSTFHTTAPAGQVILQSPPGGTPVAPGSSVALTVSAGPQPVTVPGVIGATEEAAGAILQASQLTVGVVTLASSSQVPAGRVLAQSPAPGTVVVAQTGVNLTISSGAALTVSLARSALQAGEAVPFAAQAFDAAGQPIVPLPPVTLQITSAPGEALGALPAIAGGSIVTAASTRGAFVLRATLVGTGDTAVAAFSVAQGASANQAAFADLGAAIEAIGVQVVALEQAVATNDLAALPALRQALDASRGAIDLERLRRSTLFSPEGGLPPTTAQLTGAGFPETAGDVAWNTALRAVITKLLEIETFLRGLTPAGPQDDDARLRQLNDELAARVATLNAIAPSVHGVVRRAAVVQHLAAVRIPRLLHAQIDLITRTLTAQGLAQAWQAPGGFYAPLGIEGPGAVSPDEYYRTARPAFFSLVSMVGATSIRDAIIKELYYPLIGHVVRASVILAGDGLLRTFANAGSLVSVITGASQSFHFFEIPGSVIEGFGFDREFVESNVVYIVGPDLIGNVLDLFSSPEDLDDVADMFESIHGVLTGANSSFFDGRNLMADEVVRGCVFDFDPSCGELVYDAGFQSVYEDAAPGGFPAPVLFIVRNVVTGAWGTLVANFYPE